MNDVINTQGWVQAMWWNRIPASAWLLLLVIGICSNALFGYNTPEPETRLERLAILPLIPEHRVFPDRRYRESSTRFHQGGSREPHCPLKFVGTAVRIVRAAASITRLLLLAACTVHGARAQSLVPRAYLITPAGTNAVVLSYSRLDGGLQLDGAVPITGATANVNLSVLSFYRSLDLLGRSANITLDLPYGNGDFMGTIREAPRSEEKSGTLDSSLRFSVNLLGGAAMTPKQFAGWRQDALLGVSLTISAPTGQYDPTRLINWGNNRWAFKPEIGYSQRWGGWILDAYGAVWFYTENPDYYSRNLFVPGIQSQVQQPIFAFESHLSRNFGPRLWISLDANFWSGGATALNGVLNRLTDQRSSRVGFTASIPLTRAQSIKLSFSDGAYVHYGGNYRSISVGWQYAWLDADR